MADPDVTTIRGLLNAETRDALDTRMAMITARGSELSAYNIDDVHELGKYVI